MYIAAVAAVYITAVQLARRRRRRALSRIHDCRELVIEMISGDFPFLWMKATEFANFRANAIPGITKLFKVT